MIALVGITDGGSTGKQHLFSFTAIVMWRLKIGVKKTSGFSLQSYNVEIYWTGCFSLVACCRIEVSTLLQWGADSLLDWCTCLEEAS